MTATEVVGVGYRIFATICTIRMSFRCFVQTFIPSVYFFAPPRRPSFLTVLGAVLSYLHIFLLIGLDLCSTYLLQVLRFLSFFSFINAYLASESIVYHSCSIHIHCGRLRTSLSQFLALRGRICCSLPSWNGVKCLRTHFVCTLTIFRNHIHRGCEYVGCHRLCPSTLSV